MGLLDVALFTAVIFREQRLESGGLGIHLREDETSSSHRPMRA